MKRTVPAEGAGKQFVNGSPCTLALLRAVGDLLVDLHGPHDHQSLFSRDQQTRLLDSFAGSTALREEFTLARRQLLKLREEKDAILQGEQALAREIDLLSHQVAEIDQAQLAPGEEETLLARQKAAANSQRIGEICTQLTAGVNESDDSLTSRLGELSRLARELSRLDPGSEDIARSCDEVFTAADSLARAITTYSASLEDGPANLEEIESRLDVLQTLKRKYGHTVEAVLDFAAQAAARLEELTGRARTPRHARRRHRRRRARHARPRPQAHDETHRQREEARRQGQGGAERLGFAKAEFSIALEKLADPGPHGCEQAEFQFLPNPGEPARPLRAIASSGEISRVMLALKGALADQDDVPVLVFDEIDANVAEKSPPRWA